MPACTKEFTLTVATSLEPLAWWKMEEAGNLNRVDAVNSIPLQVLNNLEGPGRQPGVVAFGMAEGLSSGVGGVKFDFETPSDVLDLQCSVNNGFALTGWFNLISDPNNSSVNYFFAMRNGGGNVERFVLQFIVGLLSMATLDNFSGASGSYNAAAGEFFFFHAHWNPTTGIFACEVRNPNTVIRNVGPVTQNGDLIVSDDPVFLVGDVGSLIKLASVDMFYNIIAYIDDFTVQVDAIDLVGETNAQVCADMVYQACSPAIFPIGPVDAGYFNLYGENNGVQIQAIMDETAIFGGNLTDGNVNFIWNGGAGRTYPF